MNALTRNTADLERLEGIITRNLQSFYEVGRALMEIRDRELYRDALGFPTFESYCKAKWSFTRQTAYQFIDSAKVIENVSDCLQKPSNEYQTRPLARLTPEKQREAWKEAVETAPEGKVTAAHVYKIVKGMEEPTMKKAEPAPREPQEPSDAMVFAGIAISQLERIHPKDPRREEALRKVENWISKNRSGGRK